MKYFSSMFTLFALVLSAVAFAAPQAQNAEQPVIVYTTLESVR